MSALHATATTSRDVSGRTHRRHCQTRRQVGASHRLAPAGCVPGAGGPGRGRRRSARAPRGQPHGVPRMPPNAPAGHRSGGRTATLRSHRVSSLARGARRPRRHRPHHRMAARCRALLHRSRTRRRRRPDGLGRGTRRARAHSAVRRAVAGPYRPRARRSWRCCTVCAARSPSSKRMRTESTRSVTTAVSRPGEAGRSTFGMEALCRVRDVPALLCPRRLAVSDPQMRRRQGR
jgi:hypothetical protein